MSIVDQLMAIDSGKVKKKEGTLRMKLSRVGESFDFHCVEVDAEKATELSESSLSISASGSIGVSTFETRIKLIMLGCEAFRSHELKEHFSCPTNKELIKKLLTVGEINYLSDYIMSLGGMEYSDSDIVDEIKN